MSKYPDKFNPETDRAAQNEQAITDALDALYATFITDDITAGYRGKAIQAVNSMARMMGYDHLVRTD